MVTSSEFCSRCNTPVKLKCIVCDRMRNTPLTLVDRRSLLNVSFRIRESKNNNVKTSVNSKNPFLKSKLLDRFYENQDMVFTNYLLFSSISVNEVLEIYDLNLWNSLLNLNCKYWNPVLYLSLILPRTWMIYHRYL